MMSSILSLLFAVINLITCCNSYGPGFDYYSIESYDDDYTNVVFNASSKEMPKRIKNITLNKINDVETRCKHTDMASEENDKSENLLIGYPFAASIQRKGAHYATGALMNKKWILSSASEFYTVRESIKLFRARLGSVDCKRGGFLNSIKYSVVHPSYVYGKPNFDVTLLRMAIPVEYSLVVQPINISKVTAKVVSANFMTTYWPRIVIKGQALPKHANERIKQSSMRVSTQRMIPWGECSVSLTTLNETLDGSSLCLKPISLHHSACMPDVGAPVIANNVLWGITSGWISANCIESTSPTIFTRISSSAVLSWLDVHLPDV